MIYKFKAKIGTAHLSALDPQVAGQELEGLRQANNGKLETTLVVEHARDEKSPLHPAFTWDDGEAAHKWRLTQAQALIRSVVLVDESTGEEKSRAFYAITYKDGEDGAERYFQSAAVIATSPTEYRSAVARIIGDLSGVERSLNQLQTLAPKASKMQVHRAGGHVVEAHRLLSVTAP